MNMIMWLARLFMVWVAIIFHVASANEEILYGWQQPVEASNEAASATFIGHAAFPPVERESRTAENALNTRKKVRLQTDESDDDLLTIGLGTGGAYYPSYPSSYGQSSRSEVISVLTKKHNHLANNHETFQFKSKHHQLSPSGISLEQVNSQASSASTTRRDFLSDFDKTCETDASASTKHYIPSPTNPPESLSESFNLGRKTRLQSVAHLTRGPLGNSGTYEQDGGRGAKRKIWSTWGRSLSLKTSVTSDENDVKHSYATPDFLSKFPSEQLNRLSAEESGIAMPQFNPQQQVIWIFQRGSNTPFHQNAGASIVPVLPSGGRIPREMSSMAGQNGGNVLLSLNPPEQGENGKCWGADQVKTSSPRSRPQNRLSAKQTTLVDWPKSTELLWNQSPRSHHHLCESGNQGSSSEDAENSPQVSKMPQPHQPESVTTVGNYASQIDGIKNYGRIKFNTALFKVEGPHRLEKSYVVRLLNSIPRPYRGNYLFTDYQLGVAYEGLRRRGPIFIPKLSMHEIRLFMGNIERWYQYWNTHANIDVESLHKGEDQASKCQFVLPLFLFYVEMIISIIPFRKGIPSGVELNYPQEMRCAIESYSDFKMLMNTPPENGELKIWNEKWNSFKRSSYNAHTEPSGIIWKFIEFWMESHYTAVWNSVKEKRGFHVSKDVKSFFNSIFAHGVETLNENLSNYLPNE